jgi:hypothetical protein
MDRVELKKFLDEEQAHAQKWYENAKKAVAETEKNFTDFDEYVLSRGKSNLSAEEIAKYKEAKVLVEEAREELIFFDGVKKGVDLVAQQIRNRMAMEELANAGKWIASNIKPRRR